MGNHRNLPQQEGLLESSKTLIPGGQARLGAITEPFCIGSVKIRMSSSGLPCLECPVDAFRGQTSCNSKLITISVETFFHCSHSKCLPAVSI